MAEEAPHVAFMAVSASLPAIRVAGVSGVKRHFMRQEAPDGTPWPPLEYPRPNGGSKLLRDKGLLYGSIQGRITERGIELVASHPGANVHQFGATIRAKQGKYLAIPVTKEAKQVGSPGKNKFPRRLFVIAPANSQNLYLAEAGTSGVVIHYILRESVTVPARPFMGFSEETLSTIEKIIADRAERVLVRMYDRTVRLDPPPETDPFT